MYIYIYIYIYINFAFFVYCNIVETHTDNGHTGFAFTYSFTAGFTGSLLLVETAYPILNMIQVINKEARVTW